MGIDLLLEFHVEELRLMGPPPLGPQHGAGNQRIIDHEDDRIERRLEEQRDDRQLEELAPGECRIEAEGQMQPGNQRRTNRRHEDEQSERQRLDNILLIRVPPHVAHVDHIDSQQKDQRHGVRHQQVGHLVEALDRERGRGKEFYISQSEGEDHPHGQQHQPDAGRPRRRPRSIVAAPEEFGEPDYAPAENLGREEGRYGMHGERRADDPLDQRGAPVPSR